MTTCEISIAERVHLSQFCPFHIFSGWWKVRETHMEPLEAKIVLEGNLQGPQQPQLLC